MANIDRPDGLTLVGHLHGGKPDMMTCYVDDAGTNGIFPGDPVVFTGSSHEGFPEVGIASASSTISGVCMGLVRIGLGGDNDPNAGSNVPNQLYLADNEDGFIAVCVDPHAIYEIQEDSDASNIADTDIGEFCDLTFAAGDTFTGKSTCELDSSNAGTGDNVRLLGRVRRADNDHAAANCRFQVMINEHTLNSVTTPK